MNIGLSNLNLQLHALNTTPQAIIKAVPFNDCFVFNCQLYHRSFMFLLMSRLTLYSFHRLVDHLQGEQSENWWQEVWSGWSLHIQASRYTHEQQTPSFLIVYAYLVLSSGAEFDHSYYFPLKIFLLGILLVCISSVLDYRPFFNLIRGDHIFV